MLRTTVLLVAIPITLAACSGSGSGKPKPPATESVAAMRAAMSTLSEAQFQQLLTLGRQMCSSDHNGMAVMEAVMADQHTTAVGRQVVHFMCPSRSTEYAALPHGSDGP